MGSAVPVGTAQVRFVSALAQHVSPSCYQQVGWFIDEDGPAIASLAELGLRSQFIPFSGVRDVAGLARIVGSLRADRPAIVHLHVGGGALGWLAHHVSHSRVVAHIWGSHTDAGQPISLRGFTANADAVVAASTSLGQLVPKPATVVYPGAELTAHPVQLESGPPWTIGTVGRLVAVKGHEHLLSALHMLRVRGFDARLEFAGTGPDEAGLRELSAELGLADAVDFLGWHEDLTPLYQRWHAFAFPSMSEGLPLAIQEAMAAGLPVVASAVGGVPELVEDNRTGYLVQPGEPSTLAERIAELLSDDELRARLGAAGRSRVERYFGIPTMVERLLAVYDRIMRRRSARTFP